MYTIHIEKIKVFAYHGVNKEENENGQYFFVDVTAKVDKNPSQLGDEIENTVSYADINKLVIKMMTKKTVRLIETLCFTIASEILQTFFQICEVTVKINKPFAPMKGEFENVAVEYTLTR